MAELWELLTPNLHLAELFVRGSVTFIGLTLLLRLVGRRETGGIGLTDLIVILLVVDAASIGLTGASESVGDSVVLVLTVLGWSLVMDLVGYRWPRLGRLFKSEPRELIRDGQVSHRAMRRELMTGAELETQLRLHGVEHLSQVRHARIEPNGMISIVLREPPETAEAPERSPEL